ncbi:Arm DNA-binding domain-containing protein, partial [Klebsiella pneumoniae]|uniref:Arm DNA-binding domain-containing protein n=1 Tax=Klebsiella pneumoniae TaxID=573 RepID=UPI002731EC57
GSKLWRYRYRFNGSAKMLALGTYPAVTLLKARQMRDESRQMLIDGIDPGEQKKAAKQAQKVEGLTFEMLAREWFAYNAPR